MKSNKKAQGAKNSENVVIMKKEISTLHTKISSVMKICLLKVIKALLTIAFFIMLISGKICGALGCKEGFDSLMEKMKKAIREMRANLFDEQTLAFLETAEAKTLWPYIRYPIHYAFIAIGVAFLFFIVWGSLAPIDSAAVAPGYIISHSNNKIIQHQEGGVINRIMVVDGQEVHEGQIMLLLNDTAARAKVEMVKSQLRTARAIEIRLNAEKQMMEGILEQEKEKMIPLDNHDIVASLDKITVAGADEKPQDSATIISESEPKAQKSAAVMDFSDYIFDMNSPEVQKLIHTQNDLYQTSERVIKGQLSILHQRIAQKIEISKGLKANLESMKNQRKLAKEDVDTFQPLTDKKLVAKYRLNEVKHKLESYDNEIIKTTHEISSNLEAISETQFQIFNTINEHFKEIYKELKEIQVNVLDLNEQFRASVDVLERMEVKAPASGYVTNLQYHTVGGVITHGSRILEIVPRADKLIIEARVSPRDIASIYVGLNAKVQLSAYKSKLVPRLDGIVTHVSADRIANQNPAMSNEPFYYLAKVEIKDGELDNLNYDVKLIPGMPAEVFIVKGTRTMLQLLISPIIDSFYKAFKEA